MSDLLTYAYAVVRNAEGLREATAPLRGVAESPVSLLTDTGDDQLGLAVSHVPGQDFQEDALKQHLEDLEWLEAVARAHHGVIEALGERTTVLPLRLATVYLDDNRAREVLEAGRTMFAGRLARLSEHVEWGVKIYVESSAALAEPTVPAADLTPGRAYLRNRRQQQSVRDTVYQAAQKAAERVEAAGRRHASDRVRHRVQQGLLADAAGAVGENVVNDAYLVPLKRCDGFLADVAHAADGLDGVRVEATGPWAPYSFAMPLDESGGAAAAEGAPP
ncbi:GvpL/GvpF family gas vesicle protein [Streptomyces olivochromogenes]|uniref:Gas vesicle protein n=1 Tax=Streptomyces olivochromogenes TaxID=1963 RepID=A0A250VVT2_STROL|nr:GvpL/GvpF family gas vesicle protein [Streptomyces olivochromogenes]KUN35246.1 gas vesicle protein [Streptomyces olivochromogenes]GAX58122.1 gas vesicle protein [Streptomyces olivochromogenes]